MDADGNLKFRWVALIAAVTTPILILGMNGISKATDRDLPLIVWALAVFVLPFFLTTSNLRYWRTRGFSPFLWRSSDFEGFYFPAWTRSLVRFVSAGASGIVLKLIGLRF